MNSLPLFKKKSKQKSVIKKLAGKRRRKTQKRVPNVDAAPVAAHNIVIAVILKRIAIAVITVETITDGMRKSEGDALLTIRRVGMIDTKTAEGITHAIVGDTDRDHPVTADQLIKLN